MHPSCVRLAVVVVATMWFAAIPVPASTESLFDDTASEQVEEATRRESVETDLALCAPHLSQLKHDPDEDDFHDAVEDPQCVNAIRAAQAAGLGKAEIVRILMGASDVPDPNAPTVDHDGPPRVIP